MNYVDSAFISPAVLSLCPGILGLERGVERAIGGLRVAAYVEIEAFIITNLVAAMEEGVLDPVPVWTDVKTFDAQPFRGKIHGIIGGYPCQPFSHAGLRAGEDDPRHLWPFIREIIRTTKPAWCFFENVRGHITLGFETVYKELSELGYRVEAGIFSAEEVGATHKRERLFILAVGHTEDINKQYDRHKRSQPSIENRRSSIELADAENGFRRLLLQPRRPRQNSFEPIGSGENMADSESLSERKQTNKTYTEPVEGEARNEFEYVSEVVANNNNTGCGEFGWTLSIQPEFLPAQRCSLNEWPAGQGSYQHEWEEPRAVKPGLGCTVDGYNFRTDLLRAYGNAVVEQTAELAFTTLLQKHYNHGNENESITKETGNGC